MHCCFKFENIFGGQPQAVLGYVAINITKINAS